MLEGHVQRLFLERTPMKKHLAALVTKQIFSLGSTIHGNPLKTLPSFPLNRTLFRKTLQKSSIHSRLLRAVLYIEGSSNFFFAQKVSRITNHLFGVPHRNFPKILPSFPRLLKNINCHGDRHLHFFYFQNLMAITFHGSIFLGRKVELTFLAFIQREHV